jgi:hypothetical protein
VEILGQEQANEPFVVTLYWLKLSPEQREWWYSRKLKSPTPAELAVQNNLPSSP